MYNYIVRNYDHIDFIMYFQLSREITYQLIDLFKKYLKYLLSYKVDIN